MDFPTGTDFPDNGNQIPDGHEYEGFYWDAAAGVWRRICADATKFPPVIISPDEPEFHIDTDGDQDTTYPVSAGDLWFDEDQKALYVAGEDTADNLVWVIATPADRSVLQEEGNTTFTFPSGRNGARADDGATVYNDASELWYIYNAGKNQWIDLPPGVNTLSMQAILLRGPDDMDETFEFNQADRDLYETEALCYVNADDHDAFTRIVIPHVDTEGFAWDGLLQLIEEGDQLTLLQKDPADPNVSVTQRSDFLTVGQETINSESYNTEIEYDSEQPDHTPYFGEPVVFRFKALVNVPNDREVYYQDTPPTLNDNPGLSEGNLWVDSNTNLEYVWNGSAWEQISTDFAYVHCIENTHSEYVREVVYRRKGDGFFYTMVRGDYNGPGNPTTLSQLVFGNQVDVSQLRVGGKFTLTKGNNTDTYTVTGLTPGTERGGYDKMTVDVIGPSTSNNTYYMDDQLDFAVILPEVVGSCLKCDPEVDVTICEEVETLKNQIVELEEEIEAIAPSVERGFWTMNLLGTVANQGQMSLYDDDYTNVGSPTGLFKNAKSIWLNEKDNSGTPHGFLGVEAGELIELFVQGADEFGLYEVVDVHDETNGATQWWVIEVNFVRTLEDTSTADNGDIIRVKIFNAPEGGSADEFVRKEGDDMSGRLRFETENDVYEQDYRKPSDGNTAFIQLKHVSENITRLGTIWQPQTKDEVAIGKNLHVELSVYCTSYYGYYLKDADDGSGRKERVLIDPRIQFYEFNNDKRGRLKWGASDDRVTWTEAGGKLSSGSSSPRLTWDENRVTIPKVPGNSATVTGFTIKGATSTGYGSTVANQDAALLKVEHVGTYSDRVQYFGRIASDRDITTKQYVDETIATQLQACGLQLGRFTYKRTSDSFASGSIKSNTSTNPANITEIRIWKSNADGIVFGEDFYALAIVPKMYFHFMDKSSASYVGRIDSVEKINNGVRLGLTPITGDISGTTYVNNSYDVVISYNKYGVNKFPQ